MKRKLVRYMVAAWLILGIAWSWGQVQPRGSEDTFDLVAWNIENFPQQGQATIDSVRMIILALQVDLVTVEEITDTVAFRNLVNSLEEWEGVYSSDEYGPGNYQKTGILYRTDQITLNNVGVIFPNEWYPFPRPPLMAQVVFERGTQYFDFYLIVVHLKAGGGDDDLERRRQACQRLKSFIDQSINMGEDPDFIVAGDFNDEIDDPPGENSFTVLLEDSLHYQFLTMPLAGDPYWASYPSYNSLIDHVLVTHDVLGEYAGGETTTLRLDYEVQNYSYWVSDHRPVMSQFPVTISGVGGEKGVAAPGIFELTGVYPNPFNSSAVIEYELSARSFVQLRVYNVLGQEVRVLVAGWGEAGNHRVVWDGKDDLGVSVPSGVYFVSVASAGRYYCQKIAVIR